MTATVVVSGLCALIVLALTVRLLRIERYLRETCEAAHNELDKAQKLEAAYAQLVSMRLQDENWWHKAKSCEIQILVLERKLLESNTEATILREQDRIKDELIARRDEEIKQMNALVTNLEQRIIQLQRQIDRDPPPPNYVPQPR